MGIACSLLELRPNPQSGYYDAVVLLDKVSIPDPLKERFQVATPSSRLEIADLAFSEDGRDPVRLEEGDVFVIPLERPDWKFALGADDEILCWHNFRELLRPEEQWHPSKSEAMAVAESLVIVEDLGLFRPVIESLPPDWRIIEERSPSYEDPMGLLVYQKIRGDLVLEQIEVQYTYLDEEQKAELAGYSEAEYLSGWLECSGEEGRIVESEGRIAVVCDMEGMGEFGWTYRYIFIASDIVIAIDILSDPLEWVKTDAEKELERRTADVFLRHGYGPEGPEEWQVMIEIRLNRSGGFHKRSRAGEIVAKEFILTDGEFAEIETALAANRFFELESRSGAGEGPTTFLAVRRGERFHSVETKNFALPPFDDIVQVIRRIVLPKVEENGQ